MGRVARQVRELMHGWNLFEDAPREAGWSSGQSMPPRSSRSYARYYNDKSIAGSILNRLAVDFASVEFMHVQTDDAGIPVKIVKDSLHQCLTLDPNIDQTAFALKVDMAMTMFEEGWAAVVPVQSNMDPLATSSYDIQQMRVGRVVAWFPRKVTVEVLDDREVNDRGEPVNGGITKQMTVPKHMVAIVENPFYEVMNKPNGLFQRLNRKLAILDGIDEAAGSGKLDLIFQLPYTVRSDTRRDEAEKRRAALAEQLKDDELGIGYIDVSEKVIQLNRPIENKLLDQIEMLFKTIRSEMGITEEIMNGSADRDTINNYYDRTIEPIATAWSLEFKRKFITKTARTLLHSIEIYRDPLKLIPLSELAEIVDKLLRNAAITANEIRPKIGFMPSSDPNANKLRNPNMPDDDQGLDNKLKKPPKEVEDDEVPV